jgi:hypothetical protein
MDNPNQHDDEGDERLAGDLLVGAEKIKEYLRSIGFPADPYYLKRSNKDWPIGSTGTGGKLVASKRRLRNHVKQIASGSSSAA